MNKPAIDYRSLAISERIELVEEIWDSIGDETALAVELSTAQKAELHHRMAMHRTDPSSAIPWEDVRDTLFKTSR